MVSNATIRTPAKLNLGLEILRRRPDGYHDIATIFQAIAIFDTLKYRPDSAFAYLGDPVVPPGSDIARPTLVEASTHHGWRGKIQLTKTIPISAGLGGGSSDAALALRLAGYGDPGYDAETRARNIGADVPFFLKGGTALGTGVGDRLTPLDAPHLWFVVVVPDLRIANKTAAMFVGLQPGDFSSGSRNTALAGDLERGNADLPDRLPNAFERQMLEHPRFHRQWTIVRDIAGRVALSGAGPAMYSWHRSEIEAIDIAAGLRAQVQARIFVARAVGPHGDQCEIAGFKRLLESTTEPE